MQSSQGGISGRCAATWPYLGEVGRLNHSWHVKSLCVQTRLQRHSWIFLSRRLSTLLTSGGSKFLAAQERKTMKTDVIPAFSYLASSVITNCEIPLQQWRCHSTKVESCPSMVLSMIQNDSLMWCKIHSFFDLECRFVYNNIHHLSCIYKWMYDISYV